MAPARKKRRMSRKAKSSAPETQPDLRWVRARIAESGKSQNAFAADVLGISGTTLVKSLTGTRPFNVADVARLARGFSLPADEILRRLGYDVPRQTVPITGRVTSDALVSPITARRGEALPVPHRPRGCVAAIFETRHGPLAAYDGAYVLYVPRTTVEPDAVARLAIIECDAAELPILGIAQRASQPGRVEIAPFGGLPILVAKRTQSISPVFSLFFD